MGRSHHHTDSLSVKLLATESRDDTDSKENRVQSVSSDNMRGSEIDLNLKD